jgi:hypothetical protein
MPVNAGGVRKAPKGRRFIQNGALVAGAGFYEPFARPNRKKGQRRYQTIEPATAKAYWQTYSAMFPQEAAADMSRTAKRRQRSAQWMLYPQLSDYPGVDTAAAGRRAKKK